MAYPGLLRETTQPYQTVNLRLRRKRSGVISMNLSNGPSTSLVWHDQREKITAGEWTEFRDARSDDAMVEYNMKVMLTDFYRYMSKKQRLIIEQALDHRSQRHYRR